MSKNIKTTALVLVLLLAFLCGFGLGKNRGFHLNFNNNPYGTTAPSEKSDAVPVDATTAPADETPADTTPTDAKPTKPLKAPKGVEAVVAAYNKAVNRAKRSDLTIQKTAALELTPGEIAPGLAKGAAQATLRNALPPMEKEYKVPAGGAAAGKAGKSDLTAKDVLAPAGKAAKLTPDMVTAAKAKAKDGGYVIVIKLKKETAKLNEETVKQAKNHAAALTLPDPAALHAFGVKVSKAALRYDGTTLRATIDSSGRLVKLQQTLPFSARLKGKYFLFNLNAAVDGSYQETLTLTY